MIKSDRHSKIYCILELIDWLMNNNLRFGDFNAKHLDVGPTFLLTFIQIKQTK